MSVLPLDLELIESFMSDNTFSYYGDWNSLMPVISKVFEIPGGNYESDKRREFWSFMNNIEYHLVRVEFNETHKYTIEFIQWYNKTGKP